MLMASAGAATENSSLIREFISQYMMPFHQSTGLGLRQTIESTNWRRLIDKTQLTNISVAHRVLGTFQLTQREIDERRSATQENVVKAQSGIFSVKRELSAGHSNWDDREQSK